MIETPLAASVVRCPPPGRFPDRFAGSPRPPRVAAAPGWQPLLASGRIEIGLISEPDDLAALFRLRHRVFSAEYGRPRDGEPGLDENAMDHDAFDPFCHHLVARDATTGLIIGGYRILLPDDALRAGGLYADREFDLAPIAGLRAGLVEIGRACIDENHRSGIVLMLLWKALRRFVAMRGGRHVIGCCSLPLRDGGATAAARLYRVLAPLHGVPVAMQVSARRPLPLAAGDGPAGDGPAGGLVAEHRPAEDLPARDAPAVPALLRGYLKAGGRLLGAPHIDEEFGSIDLPLLLVVEALDPRFAARLG